MDPSGQIEGGAQSSEIEIPTCAQLAGFGERLLPAVARQGCLVGPAPQILLVEDEELVRRVTAEVLESAGYGVWRARHSVEAMEICRGKSVTLNLLLTDIVLPGKDGRDLANEFELLHPRGKVLFMSGYAEQLARSQSPGEKRAYLAKPFSSLTLLTKVAQVLMEADAKVAVRS